MKVVFVKEKDYGKAGPIYKTKLMGVYKKNKMAVTDIEKYTKSKGWDGKPTSDFQPNFHDTGFIVLPDGCRYDYEIVDCADGVPVMKEI